MGGAITWLACGRPQCVVPHAAAYLRTGVQSCRCLARVLQQCQSRRLVALVAEGRLSSLVALIGLLFDASFAQAGMRVLGSTFGVPVISSTKPRLPTCQQ